MWIRVYYYCGCVNKVKKPQAHKKPSEKRSGYLDEAYKMVGGICIIILSQAAVYLSMELYVISIAIFNLFAFLPNWILTFLMSLVGIGSMIGLIVIGLIIIFYVLPMTSLEINEALAGAYGILYLLFPVYPLLGYVESGGTHGFVFGWENPCWPLISLLGAIVLLFSYHPEIAVLVKRRIKRTIVVFLLGVAGLILYYFIGSFLGQSGHLETYPTPLTGVFLMAPLVAIVHSVMKCLGPVQLGFTYQNIERLQQEK